MRGVLGPREFAMRAAKNYLSASTGLRQILDLASLTPCTLRSAPTRYNLYSQPLEPLRSATQRSTSALSALLDRSFSEGVSNLVFNKLLNSSRPPRARATQPQQMLLSAACLSAGPGFGELNQQREQREWTTKYGDSGYGGIEVPAEISKVRIPTNTKGRLKMHEPRFLPKNEDELLASIFTWWDLLDRIMLKYEPGSRYLAGYIREAQLRRMIQLVREPHVKHYCEIGMNGGHSVVAMMLASPTLTVDTFDLMRWNYSQPVKELLRARFYPRFELHEGYSWDTLPVWKQKKRQCDFLLVDGGHSAGAARKDLQSLREVAAPQAKLVVDDVNSDPGRALWRLQKQGALKILEDYEFKKKSPMNPCQRKPEGRILPCAPWGFAVAQYTQGAMSAEAAREEAIK